MYIQEVQKKKKKSSSSRFACTYHTRTHHQSHRRQILTVTVEHAAPPVAAPSAGTIMIISDSGCPAKVSDTTVVGVVWFHGSIPGRWGKSKDRSGVTGRKKAKLRRRYELFWFFNKTWRRHRMYNIIEVYYYIKQQKQAAGERSRQTD